MLLCGLYDTCDLVVWCNPKYFYFILDHLNIGIYVFLFCCLSLLSFTLSVFHSPLIPVVFFFTFHLSYFFIPSPQLVLSACHPVYISQYLLNLCFSLPLFLRSLLSPPSLVLWQRLWPVVMRQDRQTFTSLSSVTNRSLHAKHWNSQDECKVAKIATKKKKNYISLKISRRFGSDVVWFLSSELCGVSSLSSVTILKWWCPNRLLPVKSGNSFKMQNFHWRQGIVLFSSSVIVTFFLFMKMASVGFLFYFWLVDS